MGFLQTKSANWAGLLWWSFVWVIVSTAYTVFSFTDHYVFVSCLSFFPVWPLIWKMYNRQVGLGSIRSPTTLRVRSGANCFQILIWLAVIVPGILWRGYDASATTWGFDVFFGQLPPWLVDTVLCSGILLMVWFAGRSLCEFICVLWMCIKNPTGLV